MYLTSVISSFLIDYPNLSKALKKLRAFFCPKLSFLTAKCAVTNPNIENAERCTEYRSVAKWRFVHSVSLYTATNLILLHFKQPTPSFHSKYKPLPIPIRRRRISQPAPMVLSANWRMGATSEAG